MKKILVVLTLVLLLMAVAEYFSIDPVWFLIVWYLSDNQEPNRCFFSRGWNSVWNRYGIDVFSISVPHEKP